jgi:hypothetical protein
MFKIFLSLNTPPFLNRQFRLIRLSSPPDLDPRIGTEDAAPLGQEQRKELSFDSYEEWIRCTFPFT